MTAQTAVAVVAAAYVVVPLACVVAIFCWPNPAAPAPEKGPQIVDTPGVQYWARGTARPVESATRENKQVGYHRALAARPAEPRSHRRRGWTL